MINFSKQTGELCKNPNHKITERSSRRLNPTNDGDFGVKRDAKWQMQNLRFTQYFQFHVINFLSLTVSLITQKCDDRFLAEIHTLSESLSLGSGPMLSKDFLVC